MEHQKFKNTVARQLQVVFGVSIAILLISSFASYMANRRLIESSKWVNHTNEVIRGSESLLSVVRDAETGQRGYIITHDARYLDTYRGAHGKALNVWATLKALTGDNADQQTRLYKIKVLLDQRFGHMQKVVAAVQQDGYISSEGLTSAKDEVNKGKVIMDALRAALADVQQNEQLLLKARLATQEKYIVYTPLLVLIAAILSIVLSILAYARIKADLDERVRRQREEARKFEETRKRINVLQKVTQEIGSGNYAARSEDKMEDDLGRISIALNEMSASLERNFHEMDERADLQKGAIELAEALRGERYTANVAKAMLQVIAARLEAHAATFYLSKEHGNLMLSAAIAAGNAPAAMHASGSLLGKVIEDRKIWLSTDLPANYLPHSTSLGNAPSVYALIVPVIFEGAVLGVMEFGLRQKPADLQMRFLEANTDAMGVSLNLALGHEKMQELLEETQAQSEELQAQHNELENINAELEAQTEKLQASDEELRVQQEELHEANQELEERARLLEERNQVIVERNLEVQAKAEELEQSTRYKSEFLANMSHELRTPLNSILLLSRLLSDNAERTLTADQIEYAKVIQSSGSGLLSLIDEILDLSKIESGKMDLEFDQVSLQEVAAQLNAMFAPIAKEKNIEWSIERDEDLPRIETDRMRLDQILKNLLSNAMKFTAKGGVKMYIRKNPLQEGFVDFVVSDTGIGISEDKQKIIFDAFRQEDGSTRRKYGGTGLGLSISRELAKLLDGEIGVFSRRDEGSTFTLTIPAKRQEPTEKPQQEERNFVSPAAETREESAVVHKRDERFLAELIPEDIPDDRNTITPADKVMLIVEDDTNFARSLLEFTRKRGYKGVVGVRGDQALELAKRYVPQGILLDVQLPLKSGLEVMEELKGDLQTRHIPVHIMSSYELKRESMMTGAVNFINKPVAFEQMQDIFSKLEQVLQKKSQKVLIVEDNPKHAKALAYFLETFDINSEIKNSIEEGVQALKQNAECVILDMGIPDANAYKTLETLKDNNEFADLPIIVFTGKSLSISEESRIKQYADSIVVKTAHSYRRILDEVSIFLHLVAERQEAAERQSFKRLGALNDVLKDKTVLVVDDDVRNIFSLTKSLEKVNMRVLTAVDGKDAIEQLQKNPQVDAVLLDMMMPQMDGYETAKIIRADPRFKRLPVIAVTAKAMTGDREKCINAGASDYITKPVDVDQLLSLLRVWLYDAFGNRKNDNKK